MNYLYDESDVDEVENLKKYFTVDCEENNVKCECECDCNYRRYDDEYKKECRCEFKYMPQQTIYNIAMKLIESGQLAFCYKFGDGPFTFYDNNGDEDDVFIFKSDSRIDLERNFGHNFEKELLLGSKEKGWYSALTVVTRCHD